MSFKKKKKEGRCMVMASSDFGDGSSPYAATTVADGDFPPKPTWVQAPMRLFQAMTVVGLFFYF